MVPTSAAGRKNPNKRANSQDARPAVSPDAYLTFLNQIELVNVWLREGRILNNSGPEHLEQVHVHLHPDEPSWEPLDGGFRVFSRMAVVFGEGKAEYGLIDVTFGLDYRSGRPMTDEIFHVFGDLNLPVNVWPYLREFLSSMTGRMGWVPLVLPLLKPDSVAEPAVQTESPKGPARRRSGSRSSRTRRPIADAHE